MIRRLCARISAGESRERLMNFEWSRYGTFKTFPYNVHVAAIRLTAAGFYYVGHGQSGEVKCFSCSVRHSDWKEGDIPLEIHRRLSPFCEFVRGTDGNNVPIHEPNSYASVAASTESTSENGVWADEFIGATGGLTQNTGSGLTNGIVQDIPDRPKFPKFISLIVRLTSLINFVIKDGVVNTKEVAEAGFFYAGFGDCVRCFHCGLGLRNWKYGDDPWIEHAKHYPWCNYLLKEKGNAFIWQHSSRDVTETMELNANASSTSEGGKQKSNGISRRKGQDLLENGRPNGSRNLEDCEEVQGQQNLQKELEELKDKLMCKICFNFETNVVFLPCGHMISCHACAPHIMKCALCRQPIEGRKKIFLS